MVQEFLSKYTDTLITINMEDYERAKAKFKKCKDIQYVPGVGIDEEKFNFTLSDEEKHELRKSLGIKDDDFVMIYPAELNENKNQIMLINAMKQLVKKYDNIHLLLPGKDSLNGYYQNITKEEGLENNIHFLGFRNDIPRLLKISNLSVASSQREGLPVNLLEAMYVGLPMVATNCRGQRDLVKDGYNGYIVEINDVNAMVNAIEKIYTNTDLRKELVENSKIDIQNYLLDKIMIRMSEIYNKKTKVLHVLASNKYSGAENVACTIISNKPDDFEMTYCSPNGPISETLKEKNIKYLPIKKLSYKEVKKIVKSYKPDIIHAHDNKATVIASLFSKRIKIISHIHGNNKIMNKLNLKTILFNLASKRITKFIWVSKSSLDDYYFKNNIVDKSIILYNVVNQSEVEIKAKEYYIDEEYDLIFLGRLGYPKNPERLIEIIDKLKKCKDDIKVAIVGNGPDKEKIENEVKVKKLDDNIKFYGFVNNPFPILKKSKMLIMTSIYEGTPMCALEAQALGKPVVSTPVDGLKDVIINKYNGFLSDDNNEIVTFVYELLNNYNNMILLNKNSLKKSKEINNIKQYIDKIIKIYTN